MQRRVFAGWSVVVALLLSLMPVSASGQVVPPGSVLPPAAIGEGAASSDVNNVEGLLQHGRQLEAQSRWADALSHYDAALRQFPEHPALERRQQIARLHYDLGRRYADSSFRGMVGKLSVSEALGLYNEVAVKIQWHYVDDPNWRRLVEHGTDALEAALSDEVFARRYLPEANAQRVGEFLIDIRKRTAGWAIRNRQEAKDAVNYIAWLGSKQLGVPQSVSIVEYVCGMANLLDDYSSFLTGGELKDVYAQIEGNFVGLGIELRATPQGLQIVRAIAASPAEKAGIQAGDLIIAVDGRSTLELNSDEAADMLQGPEGSTVQLTVTTPSQPPRLLKVRRERVEVPSVDDAKILDAQTGVAYFKLASFQKTTARDVDAALWKLHRQGMKSLIVDLRGNPGGLLTAAVEVADRFLDSGIIVSTRGRVTSEDATYRAHNGGAWQVPLVVLIDHDSASASEILAGALRDHRRATLVGTRSYGKGSVQGIFALSTGGSGVRLTTSKFYSPNGHPYSKVGVTPDVAVQVAARPVGEEILKPAGEDDPMVAAALTVARNKLSQRSSTPRSARQAQ
jgi:carboxyl-terminal processing protease